MSSVHLYTEHCSAVHREANISAELIAYDFLHCTFGMLVLFKHEYSSCTIGLFGLVSEIQHVQGFPLYSAHR